MQGSLLYMGDTSLDTAAGYLAGLMSSWNWRFDYVPSDQPLPGDLAETAALYVISDYPAARIDDRTQHRLVERVAEGAAGLLMIGGWESFHGLGGDWDGTPIGSVLPVQIADADDRLNCDHPVIVKRIAEHPIAQELPWDSRPPLVGGLNRVTSKSDATTILEARRFAAAWSGNEVSLSPAESHPLLVVGAHGKGRTAALMTDVAPHWVGPLVDWGDSRVTGHAPGGQAIEVGNLYAQFLQQLLIWASGG